MFFTSVKNKKLDRLSLTNQPVHRAVEAGFKET